MILKDIDEEATKAIDEFMKSPRNSRKSLNVAMQTVNSITNFSPKMTSVSTGRMNVNGERLPQPFSAYKKTGVIISKCYSMLCG